MWRLAYGPAGVRGGLETSKSRVVMGEEKTGPARPAKVTQARRAAEDNEALRMVSVVVRALVWEVKEQSNRTRPNGEI